MKRPNSKRNLDMAIRRLGQNDEDYLRLRMIIANTIVAQLLPPGVVKGGTALKLRFGDAKTRATTDLDAARAIDQDLFVSALEESLDEGWNGFTGIVSFKEPAHPKDVPARYVMQPFDIKLSYLGKPWCTVELELGHNEIGDADNPEYVFPEEASEILSALGFPQPMSVALMPISHQVAQKLHALSAPASDRAHDLIDLQVIVLNGQIDLAETKRVCMRLFAYRHQQSWPPHVEKGANWDGLYNQQLLDAPVRQTVDEAITWVNELIARIDSEPL